MHVGRAWTILPACTVIPQKPSCIATVTHSRLCPRRASNPVYVTLFATNRGHAAKGSEAFCRRSCTLEGPFEQSSETFTNRYSQIHVRRAWTILHAYPVIQKKP